MADLTQLAIPYPVLLAEYQERVGALTNENIMLRATVAHMQKQNTPAPMPPPEQAAPEPDVVLPPPAAES
jgi:hypothetical protein